MPSTKKTLRICIALTDVFIALLIAAVIFLPFIITVYVEVNHRSQALPATVMVTCYPCAPFAGLALFNLRKILRRCRDGRIFCTENSGGLRLIALCCAVIAVITLIAGRYYLPFYIVGGTFAFLSLLSYSANAVFAATAEAEENC